MKLERGQQRIRFVSATGAVFIEPVWVEHPYVVPKTGTGVDYDPGYYLFKVGVGVSIYLRGNPQWCCSIVNTQRKDFDDLHGKCCVGLITFLNDSIIPSIRISSMVVIG